MAPAKGRKQPEDDLLDWFTVSYRTIYTVGFLIVLLAAGAGYYFFLRTPPEPPPSTEAPQPVFTTARFTSIEGTVKVKKFGTIEWRNATAAMRLEKGDLVRTGSGSTAEIRFFDETVVDVRPDSLITIEETSKDPSTKESVVRTKISSGGFRFVVTSEPGTRQFSTPNLSATPEGEAQGSFAVDTSGETQVKVVRGIVPIQTTRGDRVQLTDNEAVRVAPSGAAAPKVALPAVPTLLAPPHQAEISYADPKQATTLLSWKGVSGAASYHLMLDESAFFSEPVVNMPGITDTSVQLRGLDTGKYYWRVAAVDRAGNEGNFSEFARFSVVRPTGAARGTPPRLVIEAIEVRTNILQIKGRTEPGASVTVNGQRLDVLGDGTFNEFITLEGRGQQTVVIRATGLNGGVAEERRSVVVAF
jgi:FecR protein